jgi:hypothetical protein
MRLFFVLQMLGFGKVDALSTNKKKSFWFHVVSND